MEETGVIKLSHNFIKRKLIGRVKLALELSEHQGVLIAVTSDDDLIRLIFMNYRHLGPAFNIENFREDFYYQLTEFVLATEPSRPDFATHVAVHLYKIFFLQYDKIFLNFKNLPMTFTLRVKSFNEQAGFLCFRD